MLSDRSEHIRQVVDATLAEFLEEIKRQKVQVVYFISNLRIHIHRVSVLILHMFICISLSLSLRHLIMELSFKFSFHIVLRMVTILFPISSLSFEFFFLRH